MLKNILKNKPDAVINAAATVGEFTLIINIELILFLII